MQLDLATLAVLAVVVAFALSLMLLLVGRLLRGQAGLGPWTLGMTSQSGAALVMGLRGKVPLLVPELVGNGMLWLATALIWMGAMDYCGRPRTLKPVWLGVVGPMPVLFWFTEFAPSFRARVIIFTVVTACWSAAIAWVFLRHGPRAQRAGTRLAGAIFIIFGLAHLARLFVQLPAEGLVVRGQATWPEAAVFTVWILFGVAWVLTIFGLVSHQLLTKLEDAARIDGLTKLLNRRALTEDGKRAIELCKRQELPIAVLLVDLDHLKVVNDSFGHAAGDAVLRHFAATASQVLRGGGLLGRYGGEEFCVILPGASLEEAHAMAERLRAQTALSPALHEGRSIPVTVSVGIAWEDGPSLEFNQLLSRADAALYRAKEEGRDRVREEAG